MVDPRIAVLLPCYNEAVAIGPTIEAFARALPGATIYVFDNNSSDGSAEVAQAAGAIVRRVRQQGKGPCRAAHVRRCGCRYLCDGRWRCDL